jgi:CheY-like chemotaxis protein
MGKLIRIFTRGPSNAAIEPFMPILSTALWCAFAITALLLFREPLTALINRVDHVKGPGFEVSAAKAIDLSAEQLKRVPESKTKVPEQKSLAELSKDDPLRASLIERWAQMRVPAKKLRILLVHDELPVARGLRDPFSALGIETDIAICADEARSLLTRHRYDAVVSDIRWDSCVVKERWQQDGIAFLKYAHESGFAQPTVFYIANLNRSQGTPAYAGGITNNWYEALHFILDIVSRRETSQ